MPAFSDERTGAGIPFVVLGVWTLVIPGGKGGREVQGFKIT